MSLEYVIRPISELDGYYLQYQVWIQDLDSATLESGVICQAFDQDDYEIGKLAIDESGKILIVEVVPERRRKGIATRMFNKLVAAGYRVEHGDNMRDDGVVWARSL